MKWTLTIDLRENRDAMLLLLALKRSKDSFWKWRVNLEVSRKQLEHCKPRLFDCFRQGAASDDKRALNTKRFGEVAGKLFGIEKHLAETGFTSSDTLMIETLVTSIPWDIVNVRGDFLAHHVPIGINIPTRITKSYSPRSTCDKSCFLHIISNPNHDLPLASGEGEMLAELVDKYLEDVTYTPLFNPTAWDLGLFLHDNSNIPFIHYSGHLRVDDVRRRENRVGLLLVEDDVFSTNNIIESFVGNSEQIVFLNGCDTAYDRRNFGNGGSADEIDMFQAASLANAFRYAGGDRVVIAPRTQIKDGDAYKAAEEIWTDIFTGTNVGTAVSNFRKRWVKDHPQKVAGYSYTLYGSPDIEVKKSMRSGVSIVADLADVGEVSPLEALIKEAAMETEPGKDVTTRHLFSILTRRWIVGHVYYDLEGQSYIQILDELRRELKVRDPMVSSDDDSTMPPLSNGARLVIENAQDASMRGESSEFHLLRAISKIGDAEVAGAILSLDKGPRDLNEIWESAEGWIDSPQKHRPALILPSGLFDKDRFLSEFAGREDTRASLQKTLSCWDLFLGLVNADGGTHQYWERKIGRPIPSGKWTAGAPLRWWWLDASAKRSVMDTISDLDNDKDWGLREDDFLYGLIESGQLHWDLLEEGTCEFLAACNLSKHDWHLLLDQLSIDTATANWGKQ